MVAQREWLEKDYYQVLGVASTATDKEITRAYRKLAKQFHPDANPGSEDRFKEISAAYDVLGDAAKRKEYDEVRRLGPAGFGGFGGPGGPRRARGRHLPGRGPRRPRRPLRRPRAPPSAAAAGAPATPGPGAAPTSRPSCYLSFEDAVRGVTTSVNVAGEARCETCHGSGAAPGTSPVTCPTCHGRGALDDNQGLFSLSRVCPQCSGRGTDHREAVQDLSRLGRGAPHPPGEGAHPRRGGGRPAHPGQGPGRARSRQRARRRPLRHRAGGQPSPSSAAGAATSP